MTSARLLLLMLIAGCGSSENSHMNDESFNKLADQWAAHCNTVKLSSNIHDYLDSPTFENLATLDERYIPLIVERYRRDDLPWNFVLERITKPQTRVDTARFSPRKEREKWLQWWDNRNNQPHR